MASVCGVCGRMVWFRRIRLFRELVANSCLLRLLLWCRSSLISWVIRMWVLLSLDLRVRTCWIFLRPTFLSRERRRTRCSPVMLRSEQWCLCFPACRGMISFSWLQLCSARGRRLVRWVVIAIANVGVPMLRWVGRNLVSTVVLE